jgi:hypothetical protein
VSETLPGITLLAPGDFKFADRGQYAAIFGGQNKFRRARERVVAQIHRHGSGVAGDAVKFHAYPALPGDGGHDADGQIIFFEHRALLDVNLRVAEKFAGFRRALTICFSFDARQIGGR